MNFDQHLADLTTLYGDIKAGRIDPAVAHELNNTAMNIQGAVRLSLLNAKMRNEAPAMAFFGNKRKVGAKR